MKTVRKLERIMGENLDQVEKNLKESLFLQVKENNKQINEKLNEVLEQNKTFADAVKTVHTGNSAKPSLQNTTETQGVNFRQIIQESKNEELVQQKEREARSQNFIIHGFSESPETQEGNGEDSNTIGELLGIIEVEAIPESITRLGSAMKQIQDQSR